MSTRTLRAISFLAPNMLPVYRWLMDTLSQRLRCAIELTQGAGYEQVQQADLAFICGLPYVHLTAPRTAPSALEALAAPVLQGERFAGRAIYFSDIIVRRDSPFQSFADLRGRSWAYNEPLSQSGYGITRFHLTRLGETRGYFGAVVQAGFHQQAIRMVARGQVDASAIDAQVLMVEFRDHPELARKLRVIDSLGPSTIQPLAAAAHLPRALKDEIRAILSRIHDEPPNRPILDRGFIDRFTPVYDGDYDDIRAMLAACEQADFLSLR